MATSYQNRPAGHAWFRTAGANLVITLANCNINATAENVQSMVVTKILSSGVWNIYRGANLVFTTSNTNNTFCYLFKAIESWLVDSILGCNLL